MAGGQRRFSFDLSIEESAFLTHELDANDPLQLKSSQRQNNNNLYKQGTINTNTNDNINPDHEEPKRNGENNNDGNFWLEARLFLELAGVSCLMNLGFIMSPLLTASYVGRSFPPVYLSAFTLANLTGNLSTFSLMAGLFSASDTLSPQAFGRGDYPEVGTIAIRGFVASFTLLYPINVVLYFYLESILVALGQNLEASINASQWYRIFAFNLPFSVLYNCLWKFLTAQHIMKPLIQVSLLCTGLVLPLSLKICINTMGFLGSALAYVIFQASQSLLLLFYVWWKHPHHYGTWPGLSSNSIRNALEWHQIKEFLHLGMGGIVAQCEWVFWEGMGLIVGQLGVVALSVHTIPNQTIMGFCMVPFSFGVAVAIRMGVSLPISVERTQALVLVTSVFSIVLFGLISVGVYVFRNTIIHVFTNDDDVKELADLIWSEVSLFNLNVAVFGILSGVATGLGKQWQLGVINFVFLWLFGLPMIYYRAIVLDQGLEAAWFWMNIPYLCMNMALTILFLFTDWFQIQEQILLKKVDSNTKADRCDDGDGDDDDDQQEGIILANETTTFL